MSPRQRKRGDHRLTSNYSEIPNILYDEWIPTLNRAGFHGHGDVLGVIARQTLGWRDLVHPIGTPELAKLSGIERSRVLVILNELEAMGAIVRERRGNGKGTALGLRLDWKADEESLAWGDEVRQGRIEKDRATRRQKAKRSPEPDDPDLTRQRVRS
ncbi:MAG: replication protein, partial [Actinomycetota bacterium]|nr:replication protein [Actinomycetota bacterium]